MSDDEGQGAGFDDDQPRIRLRVSVHGKTMEVPCGDGQQPVRWLATVVAQRFAALMPHGRGRMREEAAAKRGFFIPREVLLGGGGGGGGGEVADANAKIADVFADGSQCTVVLQRQIDLDDGNQPVPSDWATAAFCHDEAKLGALAEKQGAAAAAAKAAAAKAEEEGGGEEGKEGEDYRGGEGAAAAAAGGGLAGRAEAKGGERGGLNFGAKHTNVEEFVLGAKQ